MDGRWSLTGMVGLTTGNRRPKWRLGEHLQVSAMSLHDYLLVPATVTIFSWGGGGVAGKKNLQRSTDCREIVLTR